MITNMAINQGGAESMKNDIIPQFSELDERSLKQDLELFPAKFGASNRST
jgi:hypothetical protein